MRLSVSATDNCLGDIKSREVLVTSTPRATKHSYLLNKAVGREDEKQSVTALLWSKQEGKRTLLGPESVHKLGIC